MNAEPYTMNAELQENISLQPLNTFGLEARCQYYLRATDTLSLQALLRQPHIQALPKFVLGGGSNMLLVGDIPGLVIHNAIQGRTLIAEDEKTVQLAAGGGEVWHDFVLYTLENNWGGLENLSLIPGSVGAAPIQNIGAYGVELKEVFHHLEAMNLQTGEVRAFHAHECRFGYRDSVFKKELAGKYIITQVVFTLQKSPHTLHLDYGAIREELTQAGILAPTIRDVSNAVIAIRRSKLPDPAEIGNAGSFFKNPEISIAQYEALKAQYPTLPSYDVDAATKKIPAGWLIEQAGWKGKRMGNYGVHARQALVLVNYGGANGKDILALSEAIMADIREKFGIRLEREVNIVGTIFTP
jgi:UDP-N-acetylmuramate dehydrogenase